MKKILFFRIFLVVRTMSETLQEKFGVKIPWILGPKIRVPRIKFPTYREGSMSLPAPGRNILLMIIYGALFYFAAGGMYIQIQEPIT